MNTHNGSLVQAGAIQTTPSTPETRAKWDKIDCIDLINVKRKLVLAEPEGNGWTSEVADLAIAGYRRFLKLRAKYVEIRVVPSRLVDQVWHHHILDTRAYAKDCHEVFGGTLHHFPYFGLNGDAAERDAVFDQTDRLSIAEFGESCRQTSRAALGGAMCDGGVCEGVTRASMCDGGVCEGLTDTPITPRNIPLYTEARAHAVG